MTDPKSNEAAKTGKPEPLPEAKEPVAALPAPDPAEQLAAARKEAADNYERYVRAAADLENFRRRSIREKEDLRLYAASKVLEELLPVLDNLARGVSAAKQPDPDLKAVTG